MHCATTGVTHEWFEPLTPTTEDAKAKFNRAEYLRAVPRDADEYARFYGMCADTESRHVQLEFAFHSSVCRRGASTARPW